MEHTDEKLNIENENAKSANTHAIKIPSRENLLQGFAKAKFCAKEKLNRKTLVTIGIILVVLLGAIAGIRYATNNCMTPIRSAEKLQNKESINAKKYLETGFKSMGAKNAGEIVNLMYESDDVADLMDALEESFESSYEWKQITYGDNFKVTYTVEEKVKLEKSDLRNYQKAFRQAVKYIEDELEETEDYDSSDWADMTDDMGLSRAQAKKFINAMKEMVNDIGRPEVTNGYEVDILIRITGEMLDEPLETTSTVQVVKVNGRWIGIDATYEFLGTLDSLGSFFSGFDF